MSLIGSCVYQSAVSLCVCEESRLVAFLSCKKIQPNAAFMCSLVGPVSESYCGNNMDATKIMCCIALLRVFKGIIMKIFINVCLDTIAE